MTSLRTDEMYESRKKAQEGVPVPSLKARREWVLRPDSQGKNLNIRAFCAVRYGRMRITTREVKRTYMNKDEVKCGHPDGHETWTSYMRSKMPPSSHESVMTSRRFLGHRVSLYQRERVFDRNFHERWVGGIMKMLGLMSGIRQDTSADALPSRRSRPGLSSTAN